MCALIVGFAAAIGFFGFAGGKGFNGGGDVVIRHFVAKLPMSLGRRFLLMWKEVNKVWILQGFCWGQTYFFLIGDLKPGPKNETKHLFNKVTSAVAVLENSFVFPFNFHSELHCETHQHPENNLDKGVRQRTLGGG